MRNCLSQVTRPSAAYRAEGELDSRNITLHVDKLGQTLLSLGLVDLHLSNEATAELVRHLQAALVAVEVQP